MAEDEGAAPPAGGGEGGGKTTKYAPQVVAALVATQGGFALGCALAWWAPALEDIKERLDPGEDALPDISHVIHVGPPCAMLILAVVMNFVGRKWVILALDLCVFGSWLLLILKSGLDMMYYGRLFCGLSGGAFCLVGPIYVAEIAHKKIRGGLICLFYLHIILGMLYTYGLGSRFSISTVSVACLVPSTVILIFMILLPESPVFLLMKDKTDKAKNALLWLRWKSDIEEELEEMTLQVAESKATKAEIAAILRAKDFKRLVSFPPLLVLSEALGIVLLLIICQHFSGYHVVRYYALTIFSRSRDWLEADYFILITGLQVITALIAVFTVDLAGRRVLLLVSYIVMTVCMFIMAFFFTVSDREFLRWLAIIASNVYLMAFSLGSGPMVWLAVGELFATEVRLIAGSICVTVYWLLSFVISRTFPAMVESWGVSQIHWFYAAMCALSTLYVFVFVIETKGKSMQEIQKELQSVRTVRNNTVWNFKKKTSAEILAEGEEEKEHKPSVIEALFRRKKVVKEDEEGVEETAAKKKSKSKGKDSTAAKEENPQVERLDPQ